MKTKKKKNLDWILLKWSYLLFIIGTFTGWGLFLGYYGAFNTLDSVIARQSSIIKELRDIDRDKCIDLFFEK